MFSKKNGWWKATPSTLNFGSIGPRWSEIADFEPIFARSASAVTSSKKVQMIIVYVVPKPPKGGSKTQNAKSHFAQRKSATKFLYVKTVSDSFIGHSLVSLSVQK